MTIKDLYEWAVQNNALYLDIEVQYRDDGGDYPGRDEPYPHIADPENEESKTNRVVVL